MPHDDLYSQPLPTMADVDRMLAGVGRLKKHVICAPDVYESVRDAVRDAGFGIAYQVVKCAWLDDGQVLLGPSEAELEADLRAAGERAVAEMVEDWKRRSQCEARLWDYRPVRSSDGRPWSGIVSGL